MPYFFMPETWNGMDEHMLLLSRHLDRGKFDLAVLGQADDGPQTRLLAERASIPFFSASFAPQTPGPVRCHRLSNFLRREGIDLLHIHTPAAGGLTWPVLAARLAGVKVIVTCHQIQPWRHPLRTRLFNRFTHARLVDRTVAVSTALERSLRHNAGLRSGIHVILNGVDPPQPARTPASLPGNTADEVRVGYFGRLSPEKGVATLLHAFALVQTRSKPVRLFVVGDGPQRSEIEALANALELDERVEFLGLRSDARSLMSEMDLVVHVPEYEGFGLVLLEAMAAGKALLVNDAPGGMTELVEDGVNGRVVRAHSVEALADALDALTSDPAERARLGANGLRIYAERYSASSFAARTQSLYDAVLGGTAPQSSLRVREQGRQDAGAARRLP
jgi:2-deoxystreptamine N-acetyl-D-glucosaminyltransferase/2-deoxystreptamine glucosyltransferase